MNQRSTWISFQPRYYARNPNLLRTRGSYERLADDNPDLNMVWPVRPNPGTNRAYQLGIDRDDGSLARFTSVCAPLVYRGDRLPPELYGNVFVAEPAANLVSRIIVSDDGSGPRARKAYERGEFLASTDERFRPVFLSNAPDGTLYIADMYRGHHRTPDFDHRVPQRSDSCAEARTTDWVRSHLSCHARDDQKGHHASLCRRDRRDISSTALAHPNGWRRDTAQRLLVERGAKMALPALTTLAAKAPDWRTRLHALWTLDGLDAIQTATVTAALEDRITRSAHVGDSHRGTLAWRGQSSDPVRGVEAA